MRKIYEIADEILADHKTQGKVVYFAAKPYLAAMCSCESIESKYGVEKGRDMVEGFLANCGTWKGDVARRVKAELRQMLKDNPR